MTYTPNTPKTEYREKIRIIIKGIQLNEILYILEKRKNIYI